MSRLCRLTSASIAQSGERQTEDLKVPGSIPGRGKFSEMPGIEPGTLVSERSTKNRRLASLQWFLTFSAKWSKLENPGIDPGASRMQIERSTT